MGRYTGQREISGGDADREPEREETEGLIGFFVNTLVMRCGCEGGGEF